MVLCYVINTDKHFFSLAWPFAVLPFTNTSEQPLSSHSCSRLLYSKCTILSMRDNENFPMTTNDTYLEINGTLLSLPHYTSVPFSLNTSVIIFQVKSLSPSRLT